MNRSNLVFLLIAGGVALLVGIWYFFIYEPPTFVPTKVALEYSRRQVLGQITPGWNLRSVSRNRDRVRTIVRRVEVSDEIAGDLLIMRGGERRRTVAEIACPPADDPIWGELTSGQDVVVELSTARGPFATVACRSQVL